MAAADFLNPFPRAIAHRGDSRNYPGNTLFAFLSAVAMGVDVIETDIHLSRDGIPVVWHDATLDHMTDGKGRINEYTVRQLKEFDAGYNFTKDGGQTFPFRGKGVQLCTLEEALTACPKQRFNVDMKDCGTEMVEAFISAVRHCNAESRVCGASFHMNSIRNLRRRCPSIQTSASTIEVVPLLFCQKLHILPKGIKKLAVGILQIPMEVRGFPIVTEEFVASMHSRNIIVMVWTINDARQVHKLFSFGVDSIISDNPAMVIRIAEEMGLRS
jgi:glycerophosphoryl diester phosphodiesterase